jgi:ABC-type uncharacterized transport system involved in gliding motility auxiliary subunit
MIFDKVWWAWRKSDKRHKRVQRHYKPFFEAARKESDEKYQEVLSQFTAEADLIPDPRALIAKRLISRARNLGIPTPSEYPNNDGFDERWNFNQANGELTLTEEAELTLRREIRREEHERLQHRMRWVSLVIVPIIGLIGAIMGLISLIHSLYPRK